VSDIVRTAAPDSQEPSPRLPSLRASSRSLENRLWRIVSGWSSRRRVGATGGCSRGGAAQQRARAAGGDVAPRCSASCRPRWQS
jgi:hypothetical protein